MDIALISTYPIGQKCGGFWVTVKTSRKLLQIEGEWINPVVITDSSGEMLADVNVGKYIPLIRGVEIKVVVGIIQNGEKGTKLFIDQFEYETLTEPPAIMNLTGEEKTVRGKIRTWLVAACLQSGTPPCEIDKTAINSLIKYVMEE